LLKIGVIIVVLSVGLSVLATLALDRSMKRKAGDTIRAKRIELIDETGRVRGTLKFGIPTHGSPEPEFVLFDDLGQEAVGLTLSEQGEGTLYFNSNSPSDFREGIVSLGFLDLSDTPPPDKSFSAWGLSVNSQRAITSLGLKNSGQPLGLSTLPGGTFYYPGK